MDRCSIIIVIALGVSLYCTTSLAVLPIVYDPYDVFQNTITAKNSVESLINQAKQLQFEVQNLKKLSKGHFENTNFILNQLTNVSNQGRSISYGANNLDALFKNKFPGMQSSSNYHKDFTNWSETTYDTLKNSMLSLSLQGKLFEKESQDVKALQTLSENAVGNLESQQTSHRIALQEIGQLQKMRQLLLNQASTQNIYMAYQLQKEQSQQMAEHEWIQKSQIPFRKYNGTNGFGVTETPIIP